MSVAGRRGSRESGWNWSRPPGGVRPPPSPPPPLLPLAGAALLFVSLTAALLAALLLGSGDGTAPRGAPTPTAAATATPTPTAVPSPTPSPTPMPTETPNVGPVYSLALWDGRAWRPGGPPIAGAGREGQAVPVMLRIAGARPGESYGFAVRYTCRTLPYLSAYGRDSGSRPALAPGGPLTAVPDSLTALPDDPATPLDDDQDRRLSLWGGSFGPLELTSEEGPCPAERQLILSLLAGDDTLFLLAGAVIGPGAAETGLPLRVTVFGEQGEQRIEIDPAGVSPPP